MVTRTNVGKVALAPFDVAVSQDVTVLELDNRLLSSRYALHALTYTVAEILRFIQGTSIQGISKQILAEHSISIPILDEQNRIATVLDAADREIALLEKKLAALHELKKGLMQKLLTGPMPAKESA